MKQNWDPKFRRIRVRISSFGTGIRNPSFQNTLVPFWLLMVFIRRTMGGYFAKLSSWYESTRDKLHWKWSVFSHHKVWTLDLNRVGSRVLRQQKIFYRNTCKIFIIITVFFNFKNEFRNYWFFWAKNHCDKFKHKH